MGSVTYVLVDGRRLFSYEVSGKKDRVVTPCRCESGDLESQTQRRHRLFGSLKYTCVSPCGILFTSINQHTCTFYNTKYSSIVSYVSRCEVSGEILDLPHQLLVGSSNLKSKLQSLSENVTIQIFNSFLASLRHKLGVLYVKNCANDYSPFTGLSIRSSAKRAAAKTLESVSFKTTSFSSIFSSKSSFNCRNTLFCTTCL